MPDRALVEAYQRGQVSRRTFIRRLLASGVSLAAASVYADVLWAEASPPGAEYPDFYCVGHPSPADAGIEVSDFAYSPVTLTVVGPETDPAIVGTCVRWIFATTHSVRDPMGILASGFRGPGATIGTTYTRRFIAAGTYRYGCEHLTTVHPPMQGVVDVPLLLERTRGRVGTRFDVIWAAQPAPPGFVYDVEVRRPHKRQWRRWRDGVTEPGGEFRASKEGRFRFRARLRKADGTTSEWSRPASFRASLPG